MIVKYGDYSFANGECAMVDFRIIPKRTVRGVQRSRTIRMDCGGDFIFDTVDQDAIKTKIDAARAALEQDYKTLVLLHNDGTTESPYKLDQADPTNITGNMVVYTSWPGTDPEDYATTKAFRFAVEAEFVNPNVTMIDWRQSIRVRGTAGPIGRWERYTNRTWVRRFTNLSSVKTIIQSGYAVKFGSAPTPPPPILGPLFEYEDLREIDYEGPSLFWRRPEFFTVRWKYVFQTPLEFTPVNIYPSLQ